MKIAIPTAEGKLCMHFGHCSEFAITCIGKDEKKIISTDYLTPPPHEPGILPKWLKEQGVDLVIAGGMGSRAQGLFSNNGIEVVVGVESETPETIVQSWMQGALKAGTNVCDH